MVIKISLTSIPPRFDKLQNMINTLRVGDEIWINIPYKYPRFPDWSGELPALRSDMRLVINRCDEDLGPATKIFPTALASDPDDIIVYIDDDTYYEQQTLIGLVKHFDGTSVIGTSGFDLKNYFKRQYPRGHLTSVDVIEGYGAVVTKAKWFQDIYKDFLTLKDESKFADDLVISNLLEGIGIPRKTICTMECNIGQIKQYSYGFESDSLHKQTDGGHHENYARVLDSLTLKGKNYFNYK